MPWLMFPNIDAVLEDFLVRFLRQEYYLYLKLFLTNVMVYPRVYDYF